MPKTDLFAWGGIVSYKIRKCLRFKARTGVMPLFSSIEIETINRCNGICPFCPVNRNSDTRKYDKMKTELFMKILDDLEEIDYKGNISLFSNNEPFLDNRIIDFAKIAKERLPDARLTIFTNGSLLTLDKFTEIMKYLDKMVIDNYSDDMKKPKNIIEILDYCRFHREIKEKVTVAMRKQNEVLTTRGGESPNKKITKTVRCSCILPFQQFIIRPDGKVSLCCNDALGKVTLGDVNKNKIADIWNSETYMNVRKAIFRSRKNVSLCSRCDTVLF